MFDEFIGSYWQTLIKRLESENCLQKNLSRTAQPALQSLCRQVVCSDNETIVLPEETSDPLGASHFEIDTGKDVARIVHQYKNRCLFIVTGTCFSHCRYCFRRAHDALNVGFASDSDIQQLCDYIGEHSEITEVLLTGGDALTADDTQLKYILAELRKTRKDIIIRIGTRAPIFAPQRITEELLLLLRSFRPLWIIPHINHPAEICESIAPEAKKALQSLIDAGISMQSQTVLLRGVNDNLAILRQLFGDITSLGIKPGYLFQPDMVPGTAHFRLSLNKAITLYKELRPELSGLSSPVFAVDLPGGGGKVNLCELSPEQKKLLYSLYP